MNSKNILPVLAALVLISLVALPALGVFAAPSSPKVETVMVDHSVSLNVLLSGMGYDLDDDSDLAAIVEEPKKPYSCGPDANDYCAPEWYVNSVAIKYAHVWGPFTFRDPLAPGAVVTVGSMADIYEIASQRGFTEYPYTNQKFVRTYGVSKKDGTYTLYAEGWNWLEDSAKWVTEDGRNSGFTYFDADFENLDEIIGLPEPTFKR